jgi:ATP-dependent helicase/nuclease subunit A
MTVHGAKGLEAPIVVLADTTTPPAGPRQPRLISVAGDGAENSPPLFVWAAAKATDTDLVSAARDRARGEAEHEYRRLLYVAMTRAISRLIVCGAEGQRGRPDGCWWNLVFAALKPASEELVDEDASKMWRYRKATALAGATLTKTAPAAPLPESFPEWLDREALPGPPFAKALSPSRSYDESAMVHTHSGLGHGPARLDQRKARARGVLMHRLLQALPAMPPEPRAMAARRHLDRNAQDFTATERQLMLDQVSRVLDDAHFSALFSTGSRAEVPIVGRIVRDGREFTISGQIDRLALAGDSIFIADYKTNRPAPARLDAVPAPYLRQLALYRAVLGKLYPGKIIRAALIWTDIPDLMEIPAAALERELAIVTST